MNQLSSYRLITIAGELQVLVPNNTSQHRLSVDPVYGAVATLHDIGEVVRNQLNTTRETLLVELAVPAVGGIIHRLKDVELVRADASLGRQLLIRDDGVGDGRLQQGQLVLRALEMNLGGADDVVCVDKVHLWFESAAHEEHARAGEIGQVCGHEEAAQSERATRHTGEEHIRGVEGDNLRQYRLNEVVDGLRVLNAVWAREALGLALALSPEKLLCAV